MNPILEQREPSKPENGATLAERLAEELSQTAGQQQVFGEAVSRGPVTIVPVSSVRYGFGAGTKSEGGNEGGGGGVTVTPIGYIELGEGGAKFHPIETPGFRIAVMATAGVLGYLALRAVSRLFR